MIGTNHSHNLLKFPSFVGISSALVLRMTLTSWGLGTIQNLSLLCISILDELETLSVNVYSQKFFRRPGFLQSSSRSHLLV